MRNDNYERHKQFRNKFNAAHRRFLKTGYEGLLNHNIRFNQIYKIIGECPSRSLYHLDHIIPLSSFDFNIPEHFTLCHMPNNLRWLHYSENCSKQANIIAAVYKEPELFVIQELKEYYRKSYYKEIDSDYYYSRLYKSLIGNK